MNIQKSVAFLYTNNEVAERDIKKTIPFTITVKRINYLEINLIKEVEDLYFEICKTLLEELKKTQINGKIFHAHGLEELTWLKCPYFL